MQENDKKPKTIEIPEDLLHEILASIGTLWKSMEYLKFNHPDLFGNPTDEDKSNEGLEIMRQTKARIDLLKEKLIEDKAH